MCKEWLRCCEPNRNWAIYIHILQLNKATRSMAGYGGGATASGVGGAAGSFAVASMTGSFLLGLFKSSNVIPSSFVMPTTAGSPFLTNSYWPTDTC
jgi:hypothetical protein